MRKPVTKSPLLSITMLLVVLGWSWVGGWAQRYSFREYTEGLGNLNITGIGQDRTGYLWVGTQNGLYRYDGSHFQRFGATEGIPDRIVDNIYSGNDGTLWVSTTAGIYFKKKDGKFSEVQVPFALNEFVHPTGTTFASNRPDQVITAVGSRGLLIRKTGPDNWAAEALDLPGGFVWSVTYGPDGALWYGCGKDLCRMKDGRLTQMRQALKMPEEQWETMMVARDGHLWVRGNLHTGELLPDGSAFFAREVPGPAISEPYPALEQDAQGRILTSLGSSLALWEKDHWRMVTERNGISPFEVQKVYVDREGSVWMGVVGHGLLRWVGEDRWEAYTAEDGLVDNLVWSTMRDKQGRLWIGTESGLNWIPAGGNTPKAWQSAGIDVRRAGTLELSADGAIWMGSAAGNLVRIDARTLKGVQWKTPRIYRILSDGPHRLWIATIDGLMQIDPVARDAQPKLVTSAAFPSGALRFTDMSLDPQGHLWTTSDQGIFMLDQAGWHAIDPGTSGAKADLLAADWSGSIWVSGPSQDLMRVRVSGYKIVAAEHIGHPPLMSQGVVALVVDHRGRLWVGEDAGVTVFDGQRWRSFTQDDGLIWNDTDSFALAEDTDGSMWIGTSGGLSHLINPQLALAGSPPPPVFSEVMLGGTPVTDGAQVKWTSDPLVVSMALLSFKDTQDIGIRYRLIGEQGSGWEDTHEMTVRYRHLPPGKYRFEVTAVNASGSAVSPVASLSFTIVPLWWQDRSFQIAGAILLLIAMGYTWRRRVGLLMKQKRQLEEAVKGRTQDLEREKTELVRTKEQMRHFAEHDGLTSLWNHRIIVERLRGEVDRSQRDGTPLSIILVDLDYFKRVNDTMGHRAGDLTLRETASIFQSSVRSYDWVGRYGGEEFLLILPGSDLAAAKARAEHLRETLQAAIIEDGEKSFSVTASFGVASGLPTDYETMIQLADAALYRAKNNGRNCVVATQLSSKCLPVAVEKQTI